MKKVVLVVPNYRWVDRNSDFLWDCIPYNLCLLAAHIKDIAEVEIIDAYHKDYNHIGLTSKLAYSKPDIIGITCMMDQYGEVLHETARIAKKYCPNASVVVGGVYATVNYAKCMEDPNIDHVCPGDGEERLRHLIEKGEILLGGKPANLDVLPDYSLINYPSYVQEWTRPSVDSPPLLPYARIMTSRGCPYGCCFCQVEYISGKKWRPRSVESIIEEMEYMVNTYNVKSWVFDDDNLLQNKRRAIRLFQEMVNRGLNFPWKAIATPVFKVDDILLHWMRTSGCTYVDYAIESGTERVLKDIIHKPVDLNRAKVMLRRTQDYGIFVTCNFIIGFPGETWEEIRQTLKIAEEFNADYTKISVATPLRGTELWRLCEETSSFKPGFNEKDMWREGQIETPEFSARSLSILRAYEWDRINFSSASKREKIAGFMGMETKSLRELRQKSLQKL